MTFLVKLWLLELSASRRETLENRHSHSNRDIKQEEVDGVVVHSLGFSAEGSGFESRPGSSESMKLFSTNKLIPLTQNSTNVESHELHL